jgi:oligoribonuclease (3'-5' exoribonuclease)
MKVKDSRNFDSKKEFLNWMNMLEKHFSYSIRDISSYDELTEEEKKIIPRELFEKNTSKD